MYDVLATCHGFLVDDDCGRPIGVVEDVVLDADSAAPVQLVVTTGWRGRRSTVSVDEILEVIPGIRQLVIGCRNGHRRPVQGSTRPRRMA